MRMRVSAAVAGCLYYSGLVPLVCWLVRKLGPRLIILNYHHASNGPLRRQFLYLRRHYHVLPLELALNELYGLAKAPRACQDRRTLVALTFDDGYYDNYVYAAKLARDLQLPITIFLIPGYLENGRRFWWLEGDHLVRDARVHAATIDGRIYHLDQQEERQALIQAIYDGAYAASSVREREAFLVRAREALGLPASQLSEDDPSRPLMWAEVREMLDLGSVSFGAHTMHHPILGFLTDAAEIQREVGESRCVLEQQLGRPMRIFAYPFGRMVHIGEHGLCAVRQQGYDWAVTTIYGINSARTDPHLLRRIGVSQNQHWLVLAADMAGVWPFTRVRQLSERLIGWRRPILRPARPSSQHM